MYVSVPPRFGVSAAAAGPAMAATPSAVPRLAAANPDVLIIASLRRLVRDHFQTPRAATVETPGSTQSNVPRCRPPSGRVAPPAAPDEPGCSFRPQSGNADETRSPAAG